MSDADGLPYVRGLMEADSSGAQSDGAGEKGVHVTYCDMIFATAMLLCQLAQPGMGRLDRACRGDVRPRSQPADVGAPPEPILQVGSVMSVLSTNDVRYQGVLNHVDMPNSRITLVNGESVGWGCGAVGQKRRCRAGRGLNRHPLPTPFFSHVLWVGRKAAPRARGAGGASALRICHLPRCVRL